MKLKKLRKNYFKRVKNVVNFIYQKSFYTKTFTGYINNMWEQMSTCYQKYLNIGKL